MRFPPVAQLLLLPRDVMARGLAFLQISVKRKSIEWQISEFHAHYGSDALKLASMWYDLTTTNIPEAKLTVKRSQTKAFKCFSLLITGYGRTQEMQKMLPRDSSFTKVTAKGILYGPGLEGLPH